MLHIGHFNINLMKAMKNSAATETLVINVGLNVGPEQDSSSPLHHLLIHASKLDTFSKVREEVQDIARTREAAGGTVPIEIGAVTGKEEVRQKRKRDFQKLTDKNQDQHCLYYRKNGLIKSD